jgi:hypothetical protein
LEQNSTTCKKPSMLTENFGRSTRVKKIGHSTPRRPRNQSPLAEALTSPDSSLCPEMALYLMEQLPVG